MISFSWLNKSFNRFCSFFELAFYLLLILVQVTLLFYEEQITLDYIK